MRFGLGSSSPTFGDELALRAKIISSPNVAYTGTLDDIHYSHCEDQKKEKGLSTFQLKEDSVGTWPVYVRLVVKNNKSILNVQ